MTAALQLSWQDDFAALTIDQPNSKVNVLNRSLWEELTAHLSVLKDHPSLRGLIVRSGKPGMFLAGADLREIAAIPLEDAAAVRELVCRGQHALELLEALPCPTVALIDGPALGGGLEVALACDYRLAGTHPKVTLGLPEVKLGLIPGWGGTQRLPRIIGPAAATRLVSTGEALTATQAAEVGLVAEVVPSEQLDERGRAFLAEIGTAGNWSSEHRRKHDPVRGVTPDVVAEARQQLGQGEASVAACEVIAAGCQKLLPEALAVETEAFVRLVGSTQAREKIAAFFNRPGRNG